MENFANNPQTTLTADLAAVSGTDTISVPTTVSGFPSPNFRIRVDCEIMLVTAIASGSWTVTRGVEGTPPTAHCQGAVVSHILTAEALTSLDASYTTTGVFSTARLGSGAADSSKVLRGDGTWGTAVISVGLDVPPEFSRSPPSITTSGTFVVTKATQTANTVWAGPTGGGAAEPTFRLLVTADYPNDSVTYAKIQNVSATTRVLGRKSSGAGDVEECTLSEILDFVGSAVQGDLLARGSSAWARVPVGTDDQPLVADSGATNGVSYKVLPIAGGGTNSSTLTDDRIMVSQGGAITVANALGNGQLLIGSNGAAPVAAALTGGALIVVANGAGSISIAKGNSLITYTGTTIDTYVTIDTWIHTVGASIVASIKNTGGSYSLNWRLSVTNAHGDSEDIDFTVAPGAYAQMTSVGMTTGATIPPPWSQIIFRVQSTVSGDHTTYAQKLTSF